MIFGNFWPADFGVAAIVWFSLCLAALALLFGSLFGQLNTEQWQRRQRRQEAEEQAAAADPNAKFCCHCRWARWSDERFGGGWKCAHFTAMRSAGQYRASGEHTLENMYDCALVREHTGETACGPDGKHWKRK